MLKGFRDFIARGNVVDLAVAVVIGAAFTAVITAVVKGIVDPLIAAVFGKPNLNDVGTFTINNADFSIGLVLTALLNFLIVAAVIYFLVVAPMNTMNARLRRNDEPEPETQSDEAMLLTEIRDLLRQQRA
jgi:large conductance mechanosensitive channel